MIRVLRETHETPREVADAVSRAGGLNVFGGPNFRIVWGRNRLSWIGGKWTDRDASGNVLAERFEERLVEKYFPLDRWHLEVWQAPELYGSPEEWQAVTEQNENEELPESQRTGVRIPGLGPFPSRGEYEHCFTLEGPSGEFVPLTSGTCAYIVQAIRWSKAQPVVDGKEAIERKAAAEEKRVDAEMDAILEA